MTRYEGRNRSFAAESSVGAEFGARALVVVELRWRRVAAIGIAERVFSAARNEHGVAG